jgi:hypothetical protein
MGAQKVAAGLVPAQRWTDPERGQRSELHHQTLRSAVVGHLHFVHLMRDDGTRR